MQEVLTNYGRVKGLDRGDHRVFLGIPYAQPPVGALRWHRPLPPLPWDGTYNADRFPPQSMSAGYADPLFQKEFYDDPVYITACSEDSLYLNIWTPAADASEGLPVAFWIHGGAFLGGCGHEKEFDGAAYCRRGVILVTVNYRVGPFGFLAHPWLSEEAGAEGGPAVSGNYGTLDQIAALRWVRENIAAFGGDPERITVFGQSAGGMSTQTLLTSPLTAGMFRGAILQSCLGLEYDHDLASAEALGIRFAESAGARNLKELRALPPDKVLSLSLPLTLEGFATDRLPYTPVLDGWVLTRGFDEAMENGSTHAVPTIAGSTLNDIRTDPKAISEGDRGIVYSRSFAWAQAQRRHGRPAWCYDFVHQLPGDNAGAFHSSELWYMFGTLDRCWRPWTAQDRVLSERMLDYWTNFIKTGDPNGPGLPFWQTCEGIEDVMIFDIQE